MAKPIPYVVKKSDDQGAAPAAAIPIALYGATGGAGGIAGLNGATGLWIGTEAEYAAVATKDPKVVYVTTVTP